MKTKIGISAGLLGAAMYLLGLLSGYVVLILLAGYVLLAEENQWLRYVAVKAVALCLCFSAINAVIGLIPDILGFIGSVASVFNGTFSYIVISRIITVVLNAVALAKTVLFLLLGLKALRQGDIRIGKVDAFVRSVLQNGEQK